MMDQVTQKEVEQGQQLNDTPDISESSGQGYTEMGTVYKDPKTGKMIMVEETWRLFILIIFTYFSSYFIFFYFINYFSYFSFFFYTFSR